MIYIVLNRETPLANRGEAILVRHPQGQMGWKQRYFPDADPACVHVASVEVDDSGIYYTITHKSDAGVDYCLYIEDYMTATDVGKFWAWFKKAYSANVITTFHVTRWLPEPIQGTFPEYPKNGWKLDEAVISLCGRYRVVLNFNCKGNVIYRVYHNTHYGLFFLDVCYNWQDVKTLCRLHAEEDLKNV